MALLAASAALMAGLSAWALAGGADAARGRETLGLLTTLPIYWGETREFADALTGDAEPHWARRELEKTYVLQPVDTLDPDALATIDRLLLAQPRALSGAENVALDDWVRAGGTVLVFADPLLTGHSIYHIGDRRRPQDVALLSPILARWGLELQFDEDQPAGERMAVFAGGAIPVDLAGRFAKVPLAPDAPADCTLAAGALVADCRIGRGRALLVADAALLEQERGGGDGAAMLEQLAERAFE